MQPPTPFGLPPAAPAPSESAPPLLAHAFMRVRRVGHRAKGLIGQDIRRDDEGSRKRGKSGSSGRLPDDRRSQRVPRWALLASLSLVIRRCSLGLAERPVLVEDEVDRVL